MRFEMENGELKAYDFNELESYKIARHLEEEGVKFCSEKLKSTDNEDLKKVLSFLLNEEKRHRKIFEDRISEIKDKSEDGFEEDDISDVISSGVFNSLGGDLSKRDSGAYMEVVETGIIFENRSIVFYGMCIKNTQNESGKNALREIVSEEKKHLELLQSLTIN